MHAGRQQQIAYKQHLKDVEEQQRQLEKLEVTELVELAKQVRAVAIAVYSALRRSVHARGGFPDISHNILLPSSCYGTWRLECRSCASNGPVLPTIHTFATGPLYPHPSPHPRPCFRPSHPSLPSSSLPRQDALAAEEDRWHKNKVHQLEIQAQMMAKAAVRAVADDEKRREREIASRADAEYKNVVETVFKTVEPQRNFGRPKVNWFY